MSLAEVIARFPDDTRERYDFSKARYTKALEPITGIVCATHGEFRQYASQLRKGGAGCPQCGHDLRGVNKRVPREEVIAAANAVHNGFYSYDKMDYTRTGRNVTVTCPLHGDFQILPLNHIRGGQGCPVCGAAKRGYRRDTGAAARKTADTKLARHRERFVADARAVHGDAYDYSKTEYRGRRTRLTIVCPKHGEFTQTAEHHLSRAQGCPECSHHRSKGEAALLAFVSIFAEPRSRVRDVVPPNELDIYLPGLAIEYCGEYWHGARNAEEERATRNRHRDKYLACAAKGVKLLTIYESEWLARPAAIKRLVRGAMGKGRGSVMARKCEVRRIGPAIASFFFEAYHPQGGGGHGEHYGLYRGEKLVACVRFTLGANDRGAGADRTWTLSRYATRVRVPGGASRLMKAFVDEFSPPSIKSFSDNRYFTGGIYERLGFVLEEEIAPDYQVYHAKTGLLPKSAWQRSKIPARIRDLKSAETFIPASDHRSETTMTYLLGARRVFDCGKKRWVWRPSITPSQTTSPVLDTAASSR